MLVTISFHTPKLVVVKLGVPLGILRRLLFLVKWE